MDQVSIKYTYQHLPLQDPPKFTQIWIFGLKTNHLAALVYTNSDFRVTPRCATSRDRIRTNPFCVLHNMPC
jgi:DNA topoisomerase IB